MLGQGLNYKQLNQLFMKIDADSGGGVGKLKCVSKLDKRTFLSFADFLTIFKCVV